MEDDVMNALLEQAASDFGEIAESIQAVKREWAERRDSSEGSEREFCAGTVDTLNSLSNRFRRTQSAILEEVHGKDFLQCLTS